MLSHEFIEALLRRGVEEMERCDAFALDAPPQVLQILSSMLSRGMHI